MHVMATYIDTYKATLQALDAYPAMEQIINTTDQAVKDTYDELHTLRTPRTDGMPHSSSPQAGEAQIAAGLDKIDTYRQRYTQAREFMDWFLPAWEAISEDDRYTLNVVFFADDGLTMQERMTEIAAHFSTMTDSAYRRRSRAVHNLAKHLYW